MFVSCWLLLQARKREPSPLTRRHIGYILASLIVISVAHVKIVVIYGVDAAFTVPLGMLLIDSFGALIGIAIVKHQLFDITVLVRKEIIYSALTALIIFIFLGAPDSRIPEGHSRGAHGIHPLCLHSGGGYRLHAPQTEIGSHDRGHIRREEDRVLG